MFLGVVLAVRSVAVLLLPDVCDRRIELTSSFFTGEIAFVPLFVTDVSGWDAWGLLDLSMSRDAVLFITSWLELRVHMVDTIESW
jgi:hypothetical protein